MKSKFLKFKKYLNKKFFKKIKMSLFMNRNRFSIVEVIILLFITLVFGVVIGYFITFSFNKEVKVVDKSLSALVYDEIVNNYYKEVPVDELDKAAIKGMIDYLDDEYTSELSDDVYSDLKEQINGYFCGIGVTAIYEDEYLRVINVIEDSISDKSGIKIDDLIYEVDGVKVTDENFSDLIRGKCGSNVLIRVIREKEYLKFDLKREEISLNTVISQYFDVNNKYIGYIDIYGFSNNSYDMFVENLKRLEDKKIKSLIIDLRDNHGGVLSSTRKIMNLFFEKNTTLYGYKNRNKKTIVKDNTKESRSYPIVILMNEDTASAAEIFISAFKENYENVTLIGKATYGKNTIQTNLQLTNNYGFKYTVSEWFTSKDNSVKENGILPDIDVDMGGVNFYDDMQLQEAIELLK